MKVSKNKSNRMKMKKRNMKSIKRKKMRKKMKKKLKNKMKERLMTYRMAISFNMSRIILTSMGTMNIL
jgi:hypothetical protein